MPSPAEPYVPSAANFDGSVSGIPFDPSELSSPEETTAAAASNNHINNNTSNSLSPPAEGAYVPSAANFDGSVSGISFDPNDQSYGMSSSRPSYGRSQSVPVVRSAPLVVASAVTPIASNDASADAYPVAEATIASANNDAPVIAAVTTDTATAARNGEFVMPSIFCPDADYAGRCGAGNATTAYSSSNNSGNLPSIFSAPPGWVDPNISGRPRRHSAVAHCTSTFHPATGAAIAQPQPTARRHSTASSRRKKPSMFRRMFRGANR